MPISLLALPYELREQILTSLLCKSSSIKLQHPVECKAAFTPPISQVCRLLREQTVRVFYQVNTFTLTIDPEAIELNDPISRSLAITTINGSGENPADRTLSTLPWLCPDIMKDLRHLRINLYLPDPYNKRLWTDGLAEQLASLIASFDNGTKLKDLRILISTWHCFRELSEWQAGVLGLLERLSVRGHTQVRSRSLDGKLRASLQQLDLTSRVRDMSWSPDAFVGCCDTVENDLDWGWDGGVVI